MRTESTSPLAPAIARLRGPAARVRRWVVSRGPVARVVLLVAALAGLVTAGYLATPDATSAGSWAWIYENRHLSRDDVARIRDTLDAKGIPCYADRSGRVGVKLERKAEALVVLAKGKVAPLTLEDLARQFGESSSLFEGSDEIARRDRALLQMSLKAQIEELDESIDSAYVLINRAKVGGGFRGSEVVTGYVNLQVDGHRKLNHKVIDGIQTILTGSVPELKPEAITVLDQTGRTYLSAGNRELKEQVSSHAREEVWRDAIYEGLRHIPGVDVRVQLEQPPPPPIAAAPAPAPAETADAVRPNAPLAVEPDPPTGPVVPPPPTRPRANVWVRVPRSFYLAAFEAQNPNKRPRPEDLRGFEATTEELARHSVESAILREDLGRIDVYTVQDDLTMARPSPIPPPSGSRTDFPWPIVSGAVGALGLLIGAATFHLLSPRRASAPRPAATTPRTDFVSDGAEDAVPGPSGRVRELIRLDPEAAAGALQRWIGQGEAPG